MRGAGGVRGSRCRRDAVERIIGKRLRTRGVDVVRDSQHVTIVRGPSAEIIGQVHHVAMIGGILTPVGMLIIYAIFVSKHGPDLPEELPDLDA